MSSLIIAAYVIQYCYDDRAQQSHSRYEELVALHNHWLEGRPLALLPVHSKSPDRKKDLIFPQM
ncbi:hypothetical protein N7478_009660 [Penicillium angulare]|uniref:uncharacterized protein n=1 Tax=Penicillium angulare TaxID=116970 RepID=UPI002540540E|nr:uncharacterized protein N7478_009660 [Penicillium angulare]KAJ5266852.1 hypothetical protein N7478_009660 [Penicillium angulare]